MYYLVGTLINALLLSFYAVMTFEEHPECANTNEPDSGISATAFYTIAFIVGFVANFVDFAIVVVELYFFPVTKTDFQRRPSKLVVIARWFVRGLIIAISIF